MITITCTKIMDVLLCIKKLNFFVSTQTRARWMKLAQPASDIVNLDITDGKPCGATPASMTTKFVRGKQHMWDTRTSKKIFDHDFNTVNCL